MEIRELRYILAIAKHQNLTKAAEELFISQSALTKFLHKYEEENNLTLFIKVGNRFILSENGKVFVKKADEILRMHIVVQLSRQKFKHFIMNRYL